MAYLQIGQAIHKNQHHKIVSLGPLVHNPEVVEDFKSKGVEVISELKEVQEGTVVFSKALQYEFSAKISERIKEKKKV